MSGEPEKSVKFWVLVAQEHDRSGDPEVVLVTDDERMKDSYLSLASAVGASKALHVLTPMCVAMSKESFPNQ